MNLFSPAVLGVFIILSYYTNLCLGKTEKQDISHRPASVSESEPEKCRTAFLSEGILSVSWCQDERQRNDMDTRSEYEVIVNSEKNFVRVERFWTRRCAETIQVLNTGRTHTVHVNLNGERKYECIANSSKENYPSGDKRVNRMSPDTYSIEKCPDTKDPRAPGQPQNFKAEPESFSTIAVSWTTPNQQRTSVDLYKLFWVLPTGRVFIHTAENYETSYLVDKLQPDTLYDFSLAACFEEGKLLCCGENATLKISTPAKPVPNCAAVTVDNGMVSGNCSGAVNSDVCNITCKETYGLDGPGAITCKEKDGIADWDDKIPTCKAITKCDAPSSTAGKTWTAFCAEQHRSCEDGSATSYSAKCGSCIRNHVENPDNETLCIPVPTCDAVTVANGRASEKCTGAVNNEMCIITCKDSFVLDGPGEITCKIKDGKADWEINAPKCIAITKCDTPSSTADKTWYALCAERGRSCEDGPATSYSAKCGSCISNYVENPNNKTLCIPVPTCDPVTVANGTVSEKCTGAVNNEMCIITCKDSFFLDGLGNIACRIKDDKADWDPKAPKCIAGCPDVSTIKNGPTPTGTCTNAPENAECTYSCNGKFKLVGEKKLKCQKKVDSGTVTLKWDKEKPKCNGVSTVFVQVTTLLLSLALVFGVSWF